MAKINVDTVAEESKGNDFNSFVGNFQDNIKNLTARQKYEDIQSDREYELDVDGYIVGDIWNEKIAAEVMILNGIQPTSDRINALIESRAFYGLSSVPSDHKEIASDLQFDTKDFLKLFPKFPVIYLTRWANLRKPSNLQELRDIKGDPRPFKKITSMTERYSDIDFTFSEILLKENPFDSLSKEEFFKLFNLFLGQSQVGRLVTDPILPIEKNIAEKALSLAINHDFIEEIETIDSSLLEKFNLKSTLEDILTERGKLLSELPELRILERINDINHESLIKLAKQIESFAKNKALSSHLKINYLKNVGLPILKEIERVFNSRSKNNSQKIKELERQVYVIFDKKDMTSTAERERLSLRPIREKEILLKEGEGEKTVNTILDNIARLGYSKTT
mgnify:CR=1 FL=1